MPHLGYKVNQFLEEWLEKGYVMAISVVIQKECISNGNIFNGFSNAPGKVMYQKNSN